MLTILCTLFFLHNAMSCTDHARLSHEQKRRHTASLSQTVCYCNVLPKAVFFELATKIRSDKIFILAKIHQ